MKKTIVALATGLALVSAGLAPVIPEDMTFLYAYDYVCSGATQLVLGLDNKYAPPEYDPEPCVGTMGISVFGDKAGNLVYKEIPIEQYQDMGREGGAGANPKHTEFKNILETYLIDKVDAAIVRGSNATANGSGTSLTMAIDAGNKLHRAIFIGGRCAGTAGGVVSGITYNGVAMTKVGFGTLSVNNDAEAAFLLMNPSINTNNAVMTCSNSSAGNSMRGVAFSGVYQKGFDGGIQSGPNTATTTSYNTIRVSNPGSYHVVWFRQDSGSGHTMVLCTKEAADGGVTIAARFVGASTGNHTCLTSFTSSVTITIGVALWPADTGTWNMGDF